MKKKFYALLILFLMLIPVVKAETFNVNNFGAKDTYKLSYSELYPYSNNLLYTVDDGFWRFDPKDGKKYEMKTDQTITIYQQNDIMLISMDKKNNKVVRIDGTFKEISNKTFESFDIDYFNWNENYYILSGTKKVDGSYRRYLYYVDKEGNAIKKDEIETGYRTFSTKIKNYLGSEVSVFVDNYNNYYDIDGDKIVPYYTFDSNGSYMHFSGCKMQKMNSNGSVVSEKTFTDCDSIKGINWGDYYYVVSAKANTYDGENNNVFFKVYKIDTNLNIVDSADITSIISDKSYNLDNNDELLFVYSIFEAYGDIGFSASISNPNGDGYSHLYLRINNDLTNEPSNYQPQPVSIRSSSIASFEDDYALNSIHDTLLNREEANLPDDVEAQVFPHKDGENIVAVVRYVKNINPRENVYKSMIKYYDKNLNELYSFNCNKNLDSEDAYWGDIASYKGHYMLIASTENGNVIKMLDKDFKEVKDYSDDIKGYPGVKARFIYVGENGLFVNFGVSYEMKGAIYEEEVDPTKQQVGVKAYDSYQVLIYYSNIYSVNRKTDGHGKITANYEKAGVGTVVRFTIEPDEGYELDYVKVTDVLGNVIKFSDYSFTMPSADVTIEAVFKKVSVNPKTADIAIIGIIVLAVCTLGIGLYSYKKTKKKGIN